MMLRLAPRQLHHLCGCTPDSLPAARASDKLLAEHDPHEEVFHHNVTVVAERYKWHIVCHVYGMAVISSAWWYFQLIPQKKKDLKKEEKHFDRSSR